jgi:hypothetical protein
MFADREQAQASITNGNRSGDSMGALLLPDARIEVDCEHDLERDGQAQQHEEAQDCRIDQSRGDSDISELDGTVREAEPTVHAVTSRQGWVSTHRRTHKQAARSKRNGAGTGGVTRRFDGNAQLQHSL